MQDIKVENIVFSYDKELVLENISMEIEAGDFVCLLGQSGCGKSTFLRLMAGLSEPDSGTIFVGDKLIQGASLGNNIYSFF
ncbi:ATP-binding cassette domain-containing protein [Tissierella praeacuta]|uniref:ATP-binding cassette domain-containing protein n=1 Tax=Tissierella praeacuta TaxID=43131 RepID=UPI0028A9D6D2|nr:ATP-binding cassette domain-containing protein [Tissierella praeacuta]